MEEYQANTFSEYVNLVQNLSASTLCRGVSDYEYKLIPSIFRSKQSDYDSFEHRLMWVFKTNAKAFLKRLPSSEVEWLVIAQHHGLPTRLLDWSLSPLVACYFAVRSQKEKDGAVYINDKRSFLQEDSIKPKELNGIESFFPSHVSTRVTAQSGMFTIHPTNNYELNDKEIKKIIIPGGKKENIFSSLVKFGIHDGTMFPDLDGLCKYIKYQVGF